MNKKKVKHFIVSNIIKVVVITMIIVATTHFAKFPILDNNIALGQMNNSDIDYLALQEYKTIRSYILTFVSLFGFLMYSQVIYNIYNFIKKKEYE